MEPNFDRVPIFRAGKYPQREEAFTVEDLDEIVRTFNPGYHEPPATIDHNKSGRAYAWVERLWRENDMLYAKFKQISKELRDWVVEGAYKKRSIELWGWFEGKVQLVLRAVTWLGAATPQVKGMANVYANTEYSDSHGKYMIVFDAQGEFKETDEERQRQQERSVKYGISILDSGNVTIPSEWSHVPDEQWGDPVNYLYPCCDKTQSDVASNDLEAARAQSSIMAWPILDVIGKRIAHFVDHYKEKAMELTKDQVDGMIADAIKKATTATEAKFSEKIDALETENKALVEKDKLRTTQFTEEQKKAREAHVDGMIGKLLKDKKITPAIVDGGLKTFMLNLPPDSIRFGEDSEKSLLGWIGELFGDLLPKHVTFTEVSEDKGDAPKAGTMGFNIEQGDQKIDVASMDLNAKAQARAEEKKIPYKQALLEISREMA